MDIKNDQNDFHTENREREREGRGENDMFNKLDATHFKIKLCLNNFRRKLFTPQNDNERNWSKINILSTNQS